MENGIWASSKMLVDLVSKSFYNLKVPRYSADTFGKCIYDGMQGAPCFISNQHSGHCHFPINDCSLILYRLLFRHSLFKGWQVVAVFFFLQKKVFRNVLPGLNTVFFLQ